MFEYAILDEENFEITYLLVNYPDSSRFPGEFQPYTKPEMFLDIDRGMEYFSIYAHSFDGGKIYTVLNASDLETNSKE